MVCDHCGHDKRPEKFKPRGGEREPTCRDCTKGTTLVRCVDCGARRRTRTPQLTKRCYRCALRETIRYIGGRRRKCWACGNRFAPLGRGDDTCGACSDPPKHAFQGTCLSCGSKRPLWAHNARVCLPCLKDDETTRQRIWRTLKREREEHHA